MPVTDKTKCEAGDWAFMAEVELSGTVHALLCDHPQGETTVPHTCDGVYAVVFNTTGGRTFTVPPECLSASVDPRLRQIATHMDDFLYSLDRALKHALNYEQRAAVVEWVVQQVRDAPQTPKLTDIVAVFAEHGQAHADLMQAAADGDHQATLVLQERIQYLNERVLTMLKMALFVPDGDVR